jgi:hypothetical protein
MCHLRPNENIAEEVKDILKPEEVKALVASTHRPNYCMQARHCTTCTHAHAQHAPDSMPRLWLLHLLHCMHQKQHVHAYLAVWVVVINLMTILRLPSLCRC